MSTSLSIRHAIVGVSGIVLISKIFGFIREVVIAERYGTSLEYDIFLIAIAVPIFLRIVVVQGTNFLTVPFMTRKLSETANLTGWRDIWRVFNSLFIIIVALILAVVLAAPYLVKLIGSNLEGERLDQGVFYCRIISITLLLGFLESFLRSALNVRKKFTYPAFGTILLNIVIIITIYLFSEKLSVAAIMMGLVIGGFVQVVFLLLKFWNIDIFRYFRPYSFGSEVGKILAVGGVIVMVELLMSTFFVIDRYFASDLAEGVVSAINYCSLLVMLPVSIIGYTIGSVTFPFLSERAGRDQKDDFASLLYSALSLALVVALPCSLFYLVYAKELTAAVFFRGAFDLVSLEMTSRLLVAMTPLLLSIFFYPVLIQANYSVGKQCAVLGIAIVAIILKIALTALLRDLLDYPGIALATSIVQILVVALMAVSLARDRRIAGLPRLLLTGAKVLVASLPLLLIAYFYGTMPDFVPGMSLLSKFRVVPAAILSLLLFLIIGYYVRIKEVRSLLSGLRYD